LSGSKTKTRREKMLGRSNSLLYQVFANEKLKEKLLDNLSDRELIRIKPVSRLAAINAEAFFVKRLVIIEAEQDKKAALKRARLESGDVTLCPPFKKPTVT
jgi:hypothetical protein